MNMKIKNGVIITTERLFLRPFREEDAELASFNSKQPKVAEQMSDMILKTKQEAKVWILQTKSWFNKTDNICQILAVERIKDKKLLGLIGVASKENLGGEVEILFAITDKEQNKGYATEAARALIEWTFSHFKLDYLVAIVKINNLASQKVIEKLGFTYIEQRTLEYDGEQTVFNYYQLHHQIK